MTGFKGLRNLAVMTATAVIALACGSQTTTTSQTEKPPGVTDSEVLLGATEPLSGSASAYASISKASTAYFQYVNQEKGGVNGRKIRYKVVDDGYDPAKSVPLMHQLVEEDKVFAIFNSLGTPPNSAYREYLNQKKVPQMYTATGASKFGNDYKQYPWTIGYQPQYPDESKLYAKYVLEKFPSAKIGVLYQNDDYGKDYLDSFEAALGTAKSNITFRQTYEADAADVRSQVASIKAANPDVFFIITTPKFAVQALATAFGINYRPKLIILNSVSNPQIFMSAVTKAVGGNPDATNGVVSATWLKDPTDAKWDNDAGMKLYRSVLSKYCSGCDPNDGFHIYGMAAAFTMVDTLTKAGKDLTRQKVMDTAIHLNEPDNPFVLPSIVVKTSPTDRFPVRALQLEQYQGGKWVTFGDLIDTRK